MANLTNSNAEQFASQSDAVKSILKDAEKMVVVLKDVKKESTGIQIAYTKIDDATKDIVAKLKEKGKTEKQISKVLEERLQNQYKLANAQEKANMQMEAYAKKMQKYQEQYFAAQKKGDKEKADEAKKNYEQAKYDEENLAKLRNIKLSEYEKEREKSIKVEEKRADAFDKATRAKALKEKENATKEELREAKKLERSADKDLAAADALEGNQNQKTGVYGKDGQQITNLGGFVKEMGKELATGISAALVGLGKQLNSAVDNAISVVTEYQAKINYRLEGAGKTFDDLYKVTQKNLNVSALVKQQAVLEKIGKAIDQGIAYNVEQRAFLAEVSEKIQNTFDAFDSNLLRLVRIQAADSTAARLGMEKALNDMLTNFYQDSSYLNDAFDAVSSALIEMSSTQNQRQAVETEYVIQKWLGGLYSVGASQNAVQQIATGLGYLGSGNVAALQSNTGLQSLLAISASRAGLDYAEMLTGGLTAKDTNKLLASMVDYLAEIAKSTQENKVVTSAFGNIFGLSMSDIRSFANLSSTTSAILGTGLTYEDAINATENQLKKLPEYLGTAQMVQNTIDNAMFNTGMKFADGVEYGIYKAVDLLEQLTGGGPEIKVAPWGIGMSFKPLDIVKSGMFGFGLISSLISGGTDIYGGNSLGGWGAKEYNQYGTGFNLRSTVGSSYSQTVGNTSSTDFEDQTLKEGMDKSNEIQSATGATEQNIYEALVKEGDKELVSNIKLRLDSMDLNMSKAQSLLEEISNNNNAKSFNVNIQKVNGKEVTSDSLPTAPTQDWQTLLFAAASFIKLGTIVNGFGGAMAQTVTGSNEEEYTLQDLLKAIIPMIDGQGIPVRLESTDSMSSLMADLNKR